MNLHEGNPDFAPNLVDAARRIAKANGHRMLKAKLSMTTHEFGLGAYRLEDRFGNVVAGHRHTMTPRDVALHFGQELPVKRS